MRVRVVCLRNRGAPISRNDVRGAAGVVGDLYVEEHDDKDAHRTRRVARLAPERPKDPQLMPPLMDVQLLWVGGYGMVLSGFERISDCDYAQSWWCRVA